MVWEKAAAGKNPKPGEIQHPVRGSGGGQGQRIDFTSEQAARGSAARALSMNGGRDEIALFKERSSSKAGLIFVSKDGLPVGQKIGLLPWQRSGSLVRVDITSSGDSPHREICFFTMVVVSGVLADRAAANLMRPERD